jgi:hypothetical protein
MITIAAVSAFAFSIFQIYCVSLGLGLPADQVAPDDMTQLMKVSHSHILPFSSESLTCILS